MSIMCTCRNFAAWLMFAATATGCSNMTGLGNGAGRTIGLAEFAPDDGEGIGASPAAAIGAGEADVPPAPVTTAVDRAAEDRLPPAVAPPFVAADPNHEAVIVDSLIGEVNGRPIFAAEFFEPIHDQLVAMRTQPSEHSYPVIVESIVTQRLLDIVNDELLLADAESNLTEEQQQGLFALLRYQEELVIARGGGYEQGIQRKLREQQEDLTLDEYLAMSRNQVLLRQFLNEKVDPRVIVSWRDIEREYQRRYAEFNPPVVVKLAHIRLSTESDAAKIEDVKRRLEAGEPFAEIAESLGFETGGFWRELTTPTGDIADAEIADTMKQHLVGLEPGDTTPPIPIGASTWWLHIAAIERPPALDLYDPEVQRGIRQFLTDLRRQREVERYIGNLRERWMADDLEQMRQRLLQIARARYVR